MKGYKAFEPGLICKGKQYTEHADFEEAGAKECCEAGVMHFCEEPFDCLDYYPLVDEDGRFSEFAEVEALDKVLKTDNKRATRKLHIGAKLSFKEFIKAGVDVLVETTDLKKTKTQIGSSGDYAQIGSSGDYAKIGSSGNSAKIGSSGYSAKITATGSNSVVSAIGFGSIIKAALGNWIVLAEYGAHDGNGILVKCVKAAQVDGEKIKADTWYKLENGEFVEVEEDDGGT